MMTNNCGLLEKLFEYIRNYRKWKRSVRRTGEIKTSRLPETTKTLIRKVIVPLNQRTSGEEITNKTGGTGWVKVLVWGLELKRKK